MKKYSNFLNMKYCCEIYAAIHIDILYSDLYILSGNPSRRLRPVSRTRYIHSSVLNRLKPLFDHPFDYPTDHLRPPSQAVMDRTVLSPPSEHFHPVEYRDS